MKLSATIIGVAIACFSVWLGLTSYGKAKWQEGYLKAINAQQQSDLNHALSSLNKFNESYGNTLKMVEEVAKQADDSTVIAGPALATWLRPPTKPTQDRD